MAFNWTVPLAQSNELWRIGNGEGFQNFFSSLLIFINGEKTSFPFLYYRWLEFPFLGVAILAKTTGWAMVLVFIINNGI